MRTSPTIATPTSVNGVNIISRKAWGANEGIRCQNPTYDDSTGGATVPPHRRDQQLHA